MTLQIPSEARHFAIGALIGATTSLVNMSVHSLLTKKGFIPELPIEDNIRVTIETLKKANITKFDAQALMDAPCFFEEYSRQNNSQEVWVHMTPARMKTVLALYGAVAIPAAEEFIFRDFIQCGLLPFATKPVIKKILPNASSQVHYRVDVLARLIITSLLFAAVHLTNLALTSDNFVKMQIIYTFVLGMVLGLLRESSPGITGAIGAHMANNAVSIYPRLTRC